MSSDRDFFNKYAGGSNLNSTKPILIGGSTSYSNSGSSATNYGSIINNTSNNSNISNTARVNVIESNFEGHKSELEGEASIVLKYASDLNNNVVLSGSSEYSRISALKSAILELRNGYFSQNSGLSIKGERADELDRRFLLIEHQLDGLLRRRIQYSAKDYEGGTRNLDFTNLLNEKENQIVELEKKIQNLEERLRRATAREIELENKIVLLKADNLTLRDKSYTGQKLEDAMRREAQYEQAIKDLEAYKLNFASAASIWVDQLNKINQKYPSERYQLSREVTEILQRSGVQTYNVNGFTTIEVHSDKTVQVPVQDSRTKHLIHLLATNLKNLSSKYPKLLTELDGKLVQFFQQELIDVIEVDELDRVVEIVKFVPHAVRVENVYAYSSTKSRKVEFHLRVLIKALLEQLERIKLKTGVVLDLDEGVIGMINHEIMGIVNVDDILKVFRVVPKIVYVDKIVEKIVERVVEVPQVIPIEKYIEKIVEVPKIVEVEKVIHVPCEIIKVVDNCIEKFVEVPTYAEKVVEVPVIKEKIVNTRVEVPKIIQVEKIVEKIVTNTQYKQIEIPVHHVVKQIQEVQKIIQVAVPIEKIVEKIVEVPVYIDKIVEKIVEVVKVVEVQLIREKLVKEYVYTTIPETQVAIQEVIKEVPVIVEKIVKVETVKPVIKEVEKRVEISVPVKSVQTIIKEVEVKCQKLIPVIQVKEIEKINNIITEKIVEVEKIVDRRIQVPVIQEKVVQVPVEVIKVVIEKVHVPQIIPVKQIVEKIVYETKIVEVEKPIVQCIKDVQIVKSVVQKIVEVPKTIERIKQVKTRIQKIVEKMIEVPKVVEVEKIVQKIVVVPRVIEKIVEIPKIVEVIVEKIIEKEVIRQVQVTVEKIVEIEKPIEVERIKTVYVQVDNPVQIMVQKIVPIEKIVERKEIIQIPTEKIVSIKYQVPKEIVVEKIVPKIVEQTKVMEIQKPVTFVVEVPVEVVRNVDKPVKVVQYQQKLINTVTTVDKIVTNNIETTKVVEVQKIRQKVVEVKKPQVYCENKVIVQQKFTPVETIVEKSKIVQKVDYKIEKVTQNIEKIIEKVVECPKLVPVELIKQKLVQKYQIVELQTILPQVVKIYEIVKEVVQKIVPVHYKEEIPVEFDVVKEKIVQVAVNTVDCQVVQICKDKPYEVAKYKQVTNTINRIQKQIQQVDRYEKSEVPVFTTVEKIVEVPHILEKIVERIVVMPQVHEVLRYVHEIAETEDLGVALTGDIQIQERRYRELYGITKKQIEILLVELRKLRGTQPALVGYIELLEKYLIDFDKLAAVQRIIPVEREKIVEKDVARPVLVPTKDSEFIKQELALGLLVQKLILEIKRVKKENPNVNFRLDEDVGLLFFSELYDKQTIPVSADFASNLKRYTETAIAKANKFGDWTTDHQLILNTILQERFAIANLVKQANLEIEKTKAISDKRAEALREKDTQVLQVTKQLTDTHNILKDLINNNESLRGNQVLNRLYVSLGEYVSSGLAIKIEEPYKILGDFIGSGNDWNRVQSIIRERDTEIQLLKGKLYEIEKARTKKEFVGVDNDRTLQNLRLENNRLVTEIDRLKSSQSLNQGSSGKERQLEMKLKTANSRIQQLQSQLRTAELQLKQFKDKSSAASSSDQTPSSANLVSSQYSSSSSTSQYGANNIYTSPSYGVNSTYSVDSNSSNLASSGVKGTSYAQSGTSAYQATSKLGSNTVGSSNTSSYTSSQNSSSSAYGTYGNTTTSTYGTVGGTGATSTSTYGTTIGGTGATSTSTYGTTIGGTGATSTSTYGTAIGGTGATSTSTYGTAIGGTGATGTFATFGSSNYNSSSIGSSVNSSGIRTSGIGSSNYTFQTKKL